MERNLGMLVVVLGLVVVVVGVLIATGALSWFGRLPGDVRLEGRSTRVFVPITSMLLASIVLTVVVNLVARWFR